MRIRERIKSATFTAFPDLALRYFSFRSRRLIERQVIDLGLEKVAGHVSRMTKGRVASGPFAGARLDYEALPVHAAPKYLGTYEQELHSTVERAIGLKPKVILNVGCAEGYYAVGFALRLPDTLVLAADADPKAVRAAQHNAALNNVHVSGVGIIKSGQFASHLKVPGCLVVMDCEGAEFELLDPTRDPILQRSHILVEVHPEFGTDSEIAKRFSKTHDIERIEPVERTLSDIPPQLITSMDFEAIVAVDERTGAKSWLFMTCR
jgi:hypothetical protein